MTIAELKRLNFLRLCQEHGIGEKDGAKLGTILNASKQHGGQLLKGKSGLGEDTIHKLCVAWGIDSNEFIRPLETKQPSTPVSSPELTPLTLFRDLIAAQQRTIEQLSKRIDEQNDALRQLRADMTEDKKLLTAGAEDLLRLRNVLDEINSRMLDAAQKGDVKYLEPRTGTLG